MAVFGYPLEKLTPLLQSQGVVQAQIVIALNATLSSPKDAAIYDGWGVPVLERPGDARVGGAVAGEHRRDCRRIASRRI